MTHLTLKEVQRYPIVDSGAVDSLVSRGAAKLFRIFNETATLHKFLDAVQAETTNQVINRHEVAMSWYAFDAATGGKKGQPA